MLFSFSIIACYEAMGELFLEICLHVYHKVSVEVAIQLLALCLVHYLTG